ncbi:MAG: hypothetical protein ISEC1_P0352 [Thiomicrorhabdus sp.]|nr:MAG: hypothetical protein ISEC1_P0352 [Thiomicrorhabdus sp.]
MKNRSNSLIGLVGGISLVILSAAITNVAHATPPAEKVAKMQKHEVANLHGKVTDKIDAAGYTYIAIEVDGQKTWAAGPIVALNIGDQVGFSTKMPMRKFHSKSLNKDFALLYFVDGFIVPKGTGSAKDSKMSLSHSNQHAQAHSKFEASGKVAKEVLKVVGGKSIAEIYEQKSDLKGKGIRVKGEVTKFTAQILGKNWIHIRDSSTATDLTVTTSETAAVGDVIVLEGVIGLERDFGYGYIYPVIMEEARQVK